MKYEEFAATILMLGFETSERELKQFKAIGRTLSTGHVRLAGPHDMMLVVHKKYSHGGYLRRFTLVTNGNTKEEDHYTTRCHKKIFGKIIDEINLANKAKLA